MSAALGQYWYQDGQGSSAWSTLAPVHLPALSGREPLGFLAGLGAVSVLSRRSETPSALLSWCPDDHHAIVHSVHHSLDAVVSAMVEVLDTKVKPGWVLPWVEGFPPRRKHREPDPLRITPDEYPYLRRRMGEAGGTLAEEWLARTLHRGQVDTAGHCYVTPYIHTLPGRTIGQFFYYPLIEIRKDPRRALREALTGWRRYPQVDGWGLDHLPGGSAPGAVWLATQGLEFTLLESTYLPGRTIPDPSLWHRPNQDDDVDLMVWPLWERPLHARSGEIAALLKIPLLYPQRDNDVIRVPDEVKWLGHHYRHREKEERLFAVYAATRRPADHHPAPLTPQPAQYGGYHEVPWR